MATYKSAIGETSSADLRLLELDVYGSQRLGVLSVDQKLTDMPEPGAPIKTMEKGNKHFELTNHLGNVLSVISDRLFSTQGTTLGKVARYTADLVSSSDYYPFGMQMPGRKVDSWKYRFGFNGKEKVDEMSGCANWYSYELREYDPRLGRMKSTDPKSLEYPWQSPYAYHKNSPINFVDYMGGGDPPPSKLSEKQLISLLDPSGDAKEKFTILKEIKSGNYAMNSKELKEIFDKSTSTFVKDNKDALNQISNLSLSKGVLNIDLSKSEIDLKTENGDLILEDNATVNFSSLIIKEKTFTEKGTQSKKTTVLDISGEITFTGFIADVPGPLNPEIRKATYTSKVKTFYDKKKKQYYDNYETTARIQTGALEIENNVMYQWIPSQK